MALKSVGDPDNVETSSARTPMMTGVEKPSGDPGALAPFKGEWVHGRPTPLEPPVLVDHLEVASERLVYEPVPTDELGPAVHALRVVLARTRLTEEERAYARKALAFFDSLS